jgi:hypothetical protein
MKLLCYCSATYTPQLLEGWWRSYTGQRRERGTTVAKESGPEGIRLE